MTEQTGFMKRWSRRKIDAQSEDVENIVNTSEAGSTAEENISLEQSASNTEVEEYKTDADMLPLDQLTEESDFSDFLSPNVSEVLRRQALRKLFHMPFLNIVDGLDDYAEDYTSFAALGDIIPHEMKRMLDREKALSEEKEKEALANTDNENIDNEPDGDELDDVLDAEVEDQESELETTDSNIVINDNELTT